MLDHPAWATFAKTTRSAEIPWDQCVDAPAPEEAPIKSSIWLATPIGGRGGYCPPLIRHPL
eukprot:4092749-Prymnesium_polylepis.1